MEENGYGSEGRGIYICDKVNQPKQMLIGYMIEYLIGMPDEMLEIYEHTGKYDSIDEVYNQLKEQIEELE